MSSGPASANDDPVCFFILFVYSILSCQLVFFNFSCSRAEMMPREKGMPYIEKLTESLLRVPLEVPGE